MCKRWRSSQSDMQKSHENYQLTRSGIAHQWRQIMFKYFSHRSIPWKQRGYYIFFWKMCIFCGHTSPRTYFLKHGGNDQVTWDLSYVFNEMNRWKSLIHFFRWVWRIFMQIVWKICAYFGWFFSQFIRSNTIERHLISPIPLDFLTLIFCITYKTSFSKNNVTFMWL